MQRTNAFDLDIDDALFTIEYTAYYNIDHSYGQDADGKRGTKRITLDEIIVESVMDTYGNFRDCHKGGGLNKDIKQIILDECYRLEENG